MPLVLYLQRVSIRVVLPFYISHMRLNPETTLQQNMDQTPLDRYLLRRRQADITDITDM